MQYDEDDIQEFADDHGITFDEAEDLLEEIDRDDIWDNIPLDEHDRPDIDYMTDLAEFFDVDVSDLYDLYYGYVPGSSGD